MPVQSPRSFPTRTIDVASHLLGLLMGLQQDPGKSIFELDLATLGWMLV